MATLKMSLKKMKELQKALGGSRKGYYIINGYGQDIISGKMVSTIDKIARYEKPNASVGYYLVKGNTRNTKNIR